MAEGDSAGGGTRAEEEEVEEPEVAALLDEAGCFAELVDDDVLPFSAAVPPPVALLKNPYPAPSAASAACPFEAKSRALSKVDLKTAGLRPTRGES